MAFLDNAGDIILDAVLTDAGRQRLARGNFKIVKFAFGDEEINYELFNSSHPSGSAFYDLEIMQTPVLEAFTNNTSLMKSKLVSINRNNILYMPVLKVNSKASSMHAMYPGMDGYLLTADEKTSLSTVSGVEQNPEDIAAGVMHGPSKLSNPERATTFLGIDQGIVADGTTDGLSIRDKMPPDMMETAYLVRMDHRLLRIHAYANEARGNVGPELINQFVDDDAIATYFLAMGDGTKTVWGDRDDHGGGGGGRGSNGGRAVYDRDDMNHITNNRDNHEMFKGPIGTYLRITPKVAPSVEFSSTLFDKIGTTSTDKIALYTGVNIDYKYIDTSINVTGVTTGYSVDVPIRIIKMT